MSVKAVIWMRDSRESVKAFPGEARGRAGFELWEIQQGNEPSDFRPMPAVGIGVNEVRIRAGGAFRILYVAKFPEAVYVLHAFAKKAAKTPSGHIELARRRFRELVQQRRTG